MKISQSYSPILTMLRLLRPTVPVYQQLRDFTRLTDKEADIIAEHWSVAIKEVTRQIDHNRQLCQFFQQLASLHAHSIMCQTGFDFLTFEKQTR